MKFYNMKKSLFTFIACLIAGLTFGQSDTTKTDSVQITMSLQQYKELINALDQNIDSKATTKSIVQFIDQRAKIIADKPKKQKP